MPAAPELSVGATGVTVTVSTAVVVLATGADLVAVSRLTADRCRAAGFRAAGLRAVAAFNLTH